MSSCHPRQLSSPCQSSDYAHCTNLSHMVDLFLRERGNLAEAERAWWGDPDVPFARACRRALFTLRDEHLRDPHQWTFGVEALGNFAEQLVRNRTKFENAATFDELYRGIERAWGLARDRKPLLVYDVSRRLGHRFGCEPASVYLHAGVRAGANALKSELGRRRSRPLADFPTSIRARLKPSQAEDFLCVTGKWLRADLWD